MDSGNVLSDGDTAAADDEVLQRIEEYCESLRTEHNASAQTVRSYRCDLLEYNDWANRHRIDALAPTHRQLRRYLAELDQARYARTTINRHISSLKGFFRYQVIAGHCQSSAADALMTLRKDKSLPHRITRDEMLRILSVWAPLDSDGHVRERSPQEMRNQAILEFLYACGARVSEASDLRTVSVDFSQAQVRVIGKGSKERIIPLHDLALRSMKAYQDAARSHLVSAKGDPGYFFLSARGNRMNPDAIRKMFKDVQLLAGLSGNYTPHDMRHTFASDVLEGGADLRSVQEMLGHASLSTTQIYTHLTIGHMKDVHHQAHPRG